MGENYKPNRTGRGMARTSTALPPKMPVAVIPDHPLVVDFFDAKLVQQNRTCRQTFRFVEYVGVVGGLSVGIIQTNRGGWRGVLRVTRDSLIQTAVISTPAGAASSLEDIVLMIARVRTEKNGATS